MKSLKVFDQKSPKVGHYDFVENENPTHFEWNEDFDVIIKRVKKNAKKLGIKVIEKKK